MATAMQLRSVARSLLLPRLSASRLLRNNNQRIQWQSTETQEASKSDAKVTEKSAPTEGGKAEEKTDLSAAEKTLKEEKEKLQAQIAEITDKYKRALAETENVRTRYKRQLDDSKLYAIQGFCKDLLEVSDILDKAMGSVPEEELKRKENESLRSLYQGLQMTGTELQKVFNKHNLHRIDPLGQKFDPNLHEAMFEVPAEEGKNPSDVAVVTKIGYRLHSRTLRPALVGVVKAS
ncbi:grpE protein homolog 1, mitochondrial-like [Acanthaster planci]|uniref:GrpE protein homolog n=1 Tax=Acanthaster planci TaxID=133434 RepID=A0A8B7Y005_ACAPL|nr:grpE protein homolog 1, mitochondrial-like [Acanthaster planci]